MNAVKVEKSQHSEPLKMKVGPEEDNNTVPGKPCIDFQPDDRWKIKEDDSTDENAGNCNSKKRRSRSRRKSNSPRSTVSQKQPVEVNGESKGDSDEGDENVSPPGQKKPASKDEVCNSTPSEDMDKSEDRSNGDSTVNRKRRLSNSSCGGKDSENKRTRKDSNESAVNSTDHPDKDGEENMDVSSSDSKPEDKNGVNENKSEENGVSASDTSQAKIKADADVSTSRRKTKRSKKEDENLILVSDGEESDNEVQVISSTSEEQKETEEDREKAAAALEKALSELEAPPSEDRPSSPGFPYLNSIQEKVKNIRAGKFKPVKFPHMGTLMLEENEVIIESPSLLVPLLIKEKDEFPAVEEEEKKEGAEKSANSDENSNSKASQAFRKNFFQSSVGQILISLGASRVMEFYHRDMRRLKIRQARKASRIQDLENEVLHHNQRYLCIKESNAPFSFRVRKCKFCEFKTESLLVMDAHYMSPHLTPRREYKCNFCNFMTRDSAEITFHFKSAHNKRCVLEDQSSIHECLFCSFQSHLKAKVNVHMNRCRRNFISAQNLSPPFDFEFPGVTTKPVTIADVIAHRRMLMSTSKSSPYPNIGQGVQMESLASAFARKKLASVLNMTGTEGYPDSPTLVKHLMGQQAKQGASGFQLPPGLVLTRPRGRTPPQQQQQQSRQGSQNMLQPRCAVLSTQPANSRGSVAYIPNIGTAASQLASSGVSITPVAKQESSSRVSSSQSAVKNITLTPISSAGNQVVSQKPGPPQPVALFSNVAGSDNVRNRATLAQPGRLPVSLAGRPQRAMAPYQRLNTPPSQVVKNSSGSSFVMCEICDSYIKDLDELRSHMNWVHKVKIHPKMLVSRPPLNCQKCQWRFFTDQGLERHLLGAHGLVTTNMQEMANKNQDGGRCIICGAVFTYKLVSHMTQVHKVTLKPAHLSYKCTVCTATFTLYRLFESHVYNVHSASAKRPSEDSPSEQAKKPVVATATPVTTTSASATTVAVSVTSTSSSASSATTASDAVRKDEQSRPERKFSETKPAKCKDCRIVTENLPEHIKQHHMKECRVKLCRIEKCQKCLYSSDEMLVIRLDELGLDEDSSEEEDYDDEDESSGEAEGENATGEENETKAEASAKTGPESSQDGPSPNHAKDE